MLTVFTKGGKELVHGMGDPRPALMRLQPSLIERAMLPRDPPLPDQSVE